MRVGIIDKETVPHAPTSRFLTKEEMNELDNGWIWNRNNFIFKYNIPLMVERNIAEALIKKYDPVEFYDKKEDLRRMKYNKLKAMARKKGYDHKSTFVNKEKLISMIDSA